MKRLAYILLVLSCSACAVFERQDQTDAVASVGSDVLLQSQLVDVTRGTSGADSAALADAYIRQWAGDMLLYRKSSGSKQPELEAQVEAYRRELYLHAYEEKLTRRYMPKEVHPDSIRAYYQAHSALFVLDAHLIRGLLLVVPNGAPDVPKLRKWMAKPEENIERIEKYAYQYATGYELFLDQWHTGNQIRLQIPIGQEELTDALKKGKQIEVQDSLKTYLLEVTDKHLIGDEMPIDYAEDEIRKILLQQRQVAFLKEQKDRLIEENLIMNK